MTHDQQRVVWYEGMTLDPHHFQQWDRYRQHQLDARVGALARYGWGLTFLEVDSARLANGEFALTRASGIFPDGLVFDMPEYDALPTPRNFEEHFPATQDRMTVFLVVPSERRSGGNLLREGGNHRQEMRYVAELRSIADENTGVEERSIEMALSNLQIRFSGEPIDTFTPIVACEVVRNESGVFVLEDTYVSTCLRIGASESLLKSTRGLLELIYSKSVAFTSWWDGASRQRDLLPADVAALGTLSTLNAYVPLLRHHYESAESHPEVLFTVMLSLAGQLSTYVRRGSISARDLPIYNHHELTTCFGQLTGQLRELLLAIEIPTPPEVPNAPALISPADAAIDMTTSLSLQWSPVDGVESYQIQISTDPSFSELLEGIGGLMNTAYSVSGLPFQTIVYWRVAAKNEIGASEWASASFTTIQEPSEPEPDPPEKIQMTSARENLFTAKIDPTLAEEATLVLAAYNTEVPIEKLTTEFPRILRLASPETIDAVLRSYTRALAIESLEQLPNEWPLSEGTAYFQLQKRGPFWEDICAQGAVALFAPGEYGSATTFELLAFKPS